MGQPAGLFSELGRWRDKAIKRGKVTPFTSDIIPDWLNAELVAAQEAVGPDAAFSFLKQVPLSVRMAAERRIKKKVQAILAKYKRRAAQSVRRGEEFDYTGMADELRAGVLPELRSLTVDNALRLSVETGISFDPAIINQEALRWAREFSTEWAQGLTRTTRGQLSEALSAFVQTPGMTLGDVESLIEPAFGPVRAQMIAATETTRAYAEATNEIQGLLGPRGLGLETVQVWNSMQDELVCFPKDTFVVMDDGVKFIQNVKVGDEVLTRKGNKRVAAVSERDYDGEFVRIRAGDIVVLATIAHPFWTQEDGWTGAGAIRVGHTLLTSDGAMVKVTHERHILHYSFWPTPVYNLQVEDEPEFYANGILVHNCPICGPLEGAPKSEWESQFPKGPPAHPNCVLPGNAVSVPGLVGGAQSLYIGRAIEVTTAGGRCLTVTLNHPILTQKGWVAAGLLSEGENVIVCTRTEWIASSIYPDYDHMPAAIEQVFGSLKMSECVATSRMPVSAEDFHGDGRSVYGNIHIVGPNRLLLGDIESRLLETIGKIGFYGDGVRESALSRVGVLDLFGPSDGAPADSLMSGSDLVSAALGGHAGPLIPLGLGLSMSGGVGLSEDASNDGAADTRLARQFVLRFPSLIATDQIVSVRKFDFSGHVYDLQSGLYGLYTVNGVLSSNCRCSTSIRFETSNQLSAEQLERQEQRREFLQEAGKWTDADQQKLDALKERAANVS